MPRYRIYLLREPRVSSFREQAPHEGPLELRASYYEPSSEIEAPDVYEAWKLLQEAEVDERSFGVGDLLAEVAYAKARAAEHGIPLRQFVTDAVEEKLRGASTRGERPWLKLAGKLRDLRAETARINSLIEQEFEVIEEEDRI